MVTASKSNSVSKIPPRISTKVPVDLLRLDDVNPRLVDELPTEESIIAELYNGQELKELLQSISSNGYLDIEPLVVEVQKKQNRATVLEGNRRLAAIRLLREPDLAQQIAEKTGTRIQVPPFSKKVRSTLDEVSVYRVDNRDEARPFIAFKHINGAAKWDSYAKAKFAARWYRSGDSTLQQIAERIGDNHDTVNRMVAAIYVLDQASKEGIFQVEDRQTPRFSFSHLYTALSRRPYMEFLGLEPAFSRTDPVENPVDKKFHHELGEVLAWIYGSKSQDKLPVVVRQNPDIKILGEVIESKEGLHVLRETCSLEQAKSSAEPVYLKFSSALIRCRSHLQEAVVNLRGFDGRDSALLGISEDIEEMAVSLASRMKKKFRRVGEGDL